MFSSVFALVVTLSLVVAALVWVPLLHLCRRFGLRFSRKILPALLLLFVAGVASRSMAQGPVTPSAPFAFPATAVGGTAATHVVTFTFGSTGALASTPYSVLTKGAPNLDFRAAGTQAANACVSGHTYNTGDTCSVTASFSPTAAGLRLGAVQLSGAAGPLATALLSGTGTAPEITFPSPAAITSLGSGFSGFGGPSGLSFQGPFGVTVDGAGNVYATDETTAAVYKIVAVNGTVSASSTIVPVGSGFSAPYGIAVDGAGDVFVADNDTRKVMEIVATNGTVSATSAVVQVGSGFVVPAGVVVDGAGNVFVTEYGNLGNGNQGAYEIVAVNGVVSASSAVVQLANIGNYPVGIALDASENLYVGAQDGTIHEIAAVAGVLSPASPLTLISSGVFDTVRGLAVDPAGDLYVVDESNHTLKEIVATNGSVSSSSPIVSIGSGYVGPRGVAIDGLGNLYVADDTKQVIFKLDMVDPPSFSYATTNVGATSSDSPRISTVANIGNAPLLFSIPATGTNPNTTASFTLSSTGSTACPIVSVTSFDAGSLAPSASCTLPISFAPLRGGAVTGTTTLTDNNLNLVNASQSIALQGTGAGGSFSISPTSLTFGPTAQGSVSAAQTATITNTTSQAIYLSTGSLTDATDFTQSDNCNGLIAAGTGTCAVTFTFKPQSSGSLSSTYAIHDLNNPNSPLNVTLSGIATGPPAALTVTPNQVAFPSTTVNTTSASIVVTLKNTGGSNLQLQTTIATLGGTDPTAFSLVGSACGYTLAPNATCTLTLAFSPTSARTYNATLNIPSNDPNSPALIPLTGIGVAAAVPQAAISPTSLTFTTVVNTAAYNQTVTLSNPGTGTLNISSVAIGGANASSFSVVTSTCGAALAAGSSCTITVGFPIIVAGTYAATLTVTDNASPTTQTVALTGSVTGTAQAALAPANYSFGGVTTGTTSASQSFTLSNAGTATLSITSIGITGTNAGSFSIASNSCGASLAAGSTCSVAVSFAPASAGSFSASLSVVDTLGTQSAALGGAGVLTTPMDFTLVATPAAQSIYLDRAVSYQLALAPLSASNPYTSAINLSASGLPSGATASFAPATVTPGAATASSVLTITIPALVSSNSTDPGRRSGKSVVWSATLLLALLLAGNKRMRRKVSLARMLLLLLLLVGFSTALTGCAPGTGFAVPQSTSTITITGTSGTLVHSATVTLTLK
jgi:hypothetical protein